MNNLDPIVSLAKRRGFIFAGSEIYGGLANTWDYGPLGSQLKKNIKDAWWKYFVLQREDMVGLDASILMNPKTWEASGHVASFSDPLMDCKSCKARERADKLVEKWQHDNSNAEAPHNWAGEKTPPKDLLEFVQNKKILCPICGSCDWTEPKAFNLMFKTEQGVVEGEGKEIYMRPETAQGIFVNFKNVLESSRKKLPFGIGQIGKAFRNEITPGNFTFRTREFEQMEIEYFIPEPPNWASKREEYMKKSSPMSTWLPEDREHILSYFEEWKEASSDFYQNILQIHMENIRFRDHDDDELSHYSKGTTDVEYKFPFGWGELSAAVAYRTDFDLNQHQSYSGQDLSYLDPYTNARFVPHVLEPSFGADRVTLAVLIDAYHEETLEDGSTRIVLRLAKKIAPVQVAILPLKKNELRIVETAKKLRKLLISAGILTQYDDTGAIGKLYRRQDEIGTPYCVTIDFDTLEDGTVTLRDRDTMEQIRLSQEELFERLKAEFIFS